MERIKLSQNFYLDEFIDKETYLYYKAIGKLHYLIWKIDERIISACQTLRDMHGSMTINNWFIGGERNWSGLRIEGSEYFSPDSQHTYGRACDIIFNEVNIANVVKDLRQDFSLLSLIGVTTIEVARDGSTLSWLHLDCRNITLQVTSDDSILFGKKPYLVYRNG